MAKYISSECVLPLYLMDNVGQAEKCGLISGLSYSVIITIGLIIVCGHLLIKGGVNLHHYLIMSGIIIVVVWIVFPLIFSNGYGNIWQGYQSAQQDLMSRGLTQLQALNMLGSIDASGSGDLSTGGASAVLFANKKTPTPTPQ